MSKVNLGRVVPETFISSGMMLPYAGTTSPSGYLLCNGQAVSRTTYADLFAVIGITYGSGNGSTTFNVPNFRGKTPVGLDTSQTEFNQLGETGGAKTHTLTEAEMPKHTHNTINNAWWHGDGSDSGHVETAAAGFHHVFSSQASNLSSAGEDKPHNNLQPYITVNWIIKY